MAINVSYNTDPRLSGTAAYAAGAGEYQQRQQQRGDALAAQARQAGMQQQQLDLQRENMQLADKRYYEGIENEVDRDLWMSQQGLIEREQQIQGQMRLGDHAAELERTQRLQMMPWAQRQLEQMEEEMFRIQIDPSLDDFERESAMREKGLQLQRVHSAANAAQRAQSRFPQGQDVGDSWNDGNTGAMITRDNDGNVRLLLKPDEINPEPKGVPQFKDLAAIQKSAYEALTRMTGDGTMVPPTPQDVEDFTMRILALRNRIMNQSPAAPVEQQGGMPPPEQSAPVQDPMQGVAPQGDPEELRQAALQAAPQPDKLVGDQGKEWFRNAVGVENDEVGVVVDAVFDLVFTQGKNLISPEGRALLEGLPEPEIRKIARALAATGAMSELIKDERKQKINEAKGRAPRSASMLSGNMAPAGWGR
jgi:hypothetical protein